MRCEIFTTKKELIIPKGNFREVIIQTSSILILKGNYYWCEHPTWRFLNIL